MKEKTPNPADTQVIKPSDVTMNQPTEPLRRELLTDEASPDQEILFNQLGEFSNYLVQKDPLIEADAKAEMARLAAVVPESSQPMFWELAGDSLAFHLRLQEARKQPP